MFIFMLSVVVGEPLNREAFDWYHDVIGNKKADVVDTWWQTGKLCTCFCWYLLHKILNIM